MLKHQLAVPRSSLSDGFVCQITGFPLGWCVTIHLFYVQAASDCTLPATEGNYLEYLEQWDDPTLVKTNACPYQWNQVALQ